jgi:DNA-binding NarL/FixJ family response regulator
MFMALKLMIVDDHAVFRHLIRQAAATTEDTVLECVSADDALKSMAVFKPDCVTMDIRMPGMDAFKAIRQIREYHPKVRVLVVSSYDQVDLRRAATEAGAAGYVSKDNLSELFLLAAPQRLAAGTANRGNN